MEIESEATAPATATAIARAASTTQVYPPSELMDRRDNSKCFVPFRCATIFAALFNGKIKICSMRGWKNSSNCYILRKCRFYLKRIGILLDWSIIWICSWISQITRKPMSKMKCETSNENSSAHRRLLCISNKHIFIIKILLQCFTFTHRKSSGSNLFRYLLVNFWRWSMTNMRWYLLRLDRLTTPAFWGFSLSRCSWFWSSDCSTNAPFTFTFRSTLDRELLKTNASVALHKLSHSVRIMPVRFFLVLSEGLKDAAFATTDTFTTTVLHPPKHTLSPPYIAGGHPPPRGRFPHPNDDRKARRYLRCAHFAGADLRTAYCISFMLSDSNRWLAAWTCKSRKFEKPSSYRWHISTSTNKLALTHPEG